MARIRSLVIAMLALLALMAAPIVEAAWDNEAFESESYYSYGGSKDGTFSLTYRGQGWSVWGDRCDWNDYVFRVNVNRSYPGSDWKYYSNQSRYQRTPSGRVIYGHQLGGYDAHFCIGASEFSTSSYPNTYWTTAGVQSYVYTWRR